MPMPVQLYSFDKGELTAVETQQVEASELAALKQALVSGYEQTHPPADRRPAGGGVAEGDEENSRVSHMHCTLFSRPSQHFPWLPLRQRGDTEVRVGGSGDEIIAVLRAGASCLSGEIPDKPFRLETITEIEFDLFN